MHTSSPRHINPYDTMGRKTRMYAASGSPSKYHRMQPVITVANNLSLHLGSLSQPRWIGQGIASPVIHKVGDMKPDTEIYPALQEKIAQSAAGYGEKCSNLFQSLKDKNPKMYSAWLIKNIKDHLKNCSTEELESICEKSKLGRSPTMFNGHVMSVYQVDNGIVIEPRRFYQNIEWQNFLAKEPFLMCGVVSLLLTSDNKIIIGSRDISKGDKGKDQRTFSLQLPCGFMDSTEKSIQSLKKGEATFDDVVCQNARKELEEELCHFGKGELSKGEVIGYSTTDKAGNRDLSNPHIGVCCALFRTELNSEEVIRRHNEDPPEDAWEISQVEAIGTNELDAKNLLDPDVTFLFQNQDRTMTDDSRFALHCFKELGLNKQTTRNFDDQPYAKKARTV